MAIIPDFQQDGLFRRGITRSRLRNFASRLWSSVPAIRYAIRIGMRLGGRRWSATSKY